jgi:hypothetical protein
MGVKSEKEIQSEIQKCKDDIVYFVENYIWINKSPLSMTERLTLKLWCGKDDLSVKGKFWFKIYLRKMYYRHKEFKNS